jgi:hypothetical protein
MQDEDQATEHRELIETLILRLQDSLDDDELQTPAAGGGMSLFAQKHKADKTRLGFRVLG